MAQQWISSYHLLEEIAAGGQATVHKAWDSNTGKVVALKVMHPHLAKDSDYLERFHREARLAAAITHPNVIQIFDVGQDGDSHYMALEYQPLSLHDLIQTHGRLPVDRAVDFALQVARGLKIAHEKGIIHRDIKPQNILIAFDGTAKVTDFGIGRAADFATMTRAGAIIGTPHYMSPEQAKGLPVDPRTDLYSLGVVFYQMLTGEVPFNADTPWDVIRQQIEAQAPPLRRLRSDVPRVVEQVVSRCLEKDPDKRYQSAGEIIQSLERAAPHRRGAATSQRPLNQHPVMIPPGKLPPPPTAPKATVAKQPRSSRRAWLWGFASAFGVISVLIVLTGPRDPQPNEEPAPLVVERKVFREVPAEVIVEKAVPVALQSEVAKPRPAPADTGFVLTRGAAISGNVIDAETGLPIAGIEIKTRNIVEDGPDSYATTDDEGRYTLRGVSPGSYRIRARADRQSYIQEFYGDALSWDNASLVTVQGTESIQGINFDLMLGATLSGRLIDANTGLPVRNIGISGGPPNVGQLAWAETDSNGNYVLRGLPEGVIEVSVNGREYIQELTRVRVSNAEPVEGIDFDLTLGATISGRVTDVDTGLPISNLWVNADNTNWYEPSSGASTDAYGRYDIRGVAPGMYVIRAEGDRQGFIREIYGDTLSWEDANPVVVRGTEQVQGIDFSLKLGATISGQIVDAATGLPISNVDVSAGPVQGNHVSWARTNGDGVYVLRGLPDGVIEISVRGDDFIEQSRTVVIRNGMDINSFDF